MSELSQGYNMIGLSQGNLVGRGVIEFCDGTPPGNLVGRGVIEFCDGTPPVKNFISLAGPHAGQASVPFCGEENKVDFKKIVGDNWIEPPKRERKCNYSESEYFKQTMRQSGLARPREPRIPRMPQLHDFQFFNTQRLSELYEKEVRYLMEKWFCWISYFQS